MYLYEMHVSDAVCCSACPFRRVCDADLYVGYVYIVPHGPQEAICKTHDQHILHQLLAQVVVNSASRQARHLTVLLSRQS